MSKASRAIGLVLIPLGMMVLGFSMHACDEDDYYSSTQPSHSSGRWFRSSRSYSSGSGSHSSGTSRGGFGSHGSSHS